MATTTGIQAYYSSAYRALPQKALPLGTLSSVYEPLQQTVLEAGSLFRQYFQAVIPVGFGWASATNFDYLNVLSVGANFAQSSPSNTVVSGLRIAAVGLKSSGNAGNNVLTYFGFATANTIVGTGSVLQGGALTGTPICGATHNLLNAATNESSYWAVATGTGVNALAGISPDNVIQTDTLVLAPVAAVNLTTTAITVSGFVDFFLTGPTGF